MVLIIYWIIIFLVLLISVFLFVFYDKGIILFNKLLIPSIDKLNLVMILILCIYYFISGYLIYVKNIFANGFYYMEIHETIFYFIIFYFISKKSNLKKNI